LRISANDTSSHRSPKPPVKLPAARATQRPLTHALVRAQGRSQPPQCSGSKRVSTQLPPQSTKGATQTHEPPAQSCESPHATPPAHIPEAPQ
jgi:hypothetical protein